MLQFQALHSQVTMFVQQVVAFQDDDHAPSASIVSHHLQVMAIGISLIKQQACSPLRSGLINVKLLCKTVTLFNSLEEEFNVQK